MSYDDRDRAEHTIIEALRAFQAAGLAPEFYHEDPQLLTEEEIDDLCEELNTESSLLVAVPTNLGESLEIVHSLAAQNALDPDEYGADPDLADECRLQQLALDVVGDFMTNQFRD